MPRTRPRPFSLGDLMILVAATAFGLALARWIAILYEAPRGLSSFMSYGRSRAQSWPQALWLEEPGCFAGMLTVALVALRWRHPRPPAARVLRQPGAVACLAAAATIVVGGGWSLAETALERNRSDAARPGAGHANGFYWVEAIGSVPMTVAVAWMALALGGRWSPERSWIDRAGIAMGAYWVAWYILGYFDVALDFLMPYPQ